MAEIREIGMKPCQGTIDLLESVLEKARSGEVVSAAVATVNRAGFTANCWHNEDQYSQLVGSVTVLQVRLASE